MQMQLEPAKLELHDMNTFVRNLPLGENAELEPNLEKEETSQVSECVVNPTSESEKRGQQ